LLALSVIERANGEGADVAPETRTIGEPRSLDTFPGIFGVCWTRTDVVKIRAIGALHRAVLGHHFRIPLVRRSFIPAAARTFCGVHQLHRRCASSAHGSRDTVIVVYEPQQRLRPRLLHRSLEGLPVQLLDRAYP